MLEQQKFHDTIEQLRELQKVLNEKFALETQLTELPKQVALKEEMVFRMKENYLKANTTYRDLQKSLDLKRDELDRLQTNRKKYENEIAHVNSQRDYEQIDRSIKENIEQEQVMRSDLNMLENKLNSFSEEFANTENLLKEQELELNGMKKAVDVQLVDCQDNLNIIQKREDIITTHLDEKLVFKFERIIKSKGGDGIVPIRNNICTGCHMILPLQFVNNVCKEEEVLNCPYCSKILYYDGDLIIEELDQNEASGLQDLFADEDIELDSFDDEDFTLFLNKDNIGSDGFLVGKEEEETDDENDDDTQEDENSHETDEESDELEEREGNIEDDELQTDSDLEEAEIIEVEEE